TSSVPPRCPVAKRRPSGLIANSGVSFRLPGHVAKVLQFDASQTRMGPSRPEYVDTSRLPSGVNAIFLWPKKLGNGSRVQMIGGDAVARFRMRTAPSCCATARRDESRLTATCQTSPPVVVTIPSDLPVAGSHKRSI